MKLLHVNDISTLSGYAIQFDSSAYQTVELDDFSVLRPSVNGYYEFNVVCNEPFDSVIVAGLNARSVEVTGGGTVKGRDGFFAITTATPVTALFISLRVTEQLFDGDMFVGRIFAGLGVALPDINDNVQIADYTEDIRTFSYAGNVYGSNKYNYKTIDVQCPVVEQAEKDELNYLFNSLGTFSRIAVWFDEECFDEVGLYGVVEAKSNTSWQLNEAHFWTLGLSFRSSK